MLNTVMAFTYGMLVFFFLINYYQLQTFQNLNYEIKQTTKTNSVTLSQRMLNY